MLRPPRRFGKDETGSFVDHLGEFRKRVIIMGLALAVGFAVAYVYHHQLIEWLNAPLPEARQKPITLGVAEPLITSLKISLYAGFALALPVILWQIWAFLAPAFRKGTERALLGLVTFATALFAIGAGFGYKVALPAAVHFLTNYDTEVYTVEIRASSYYSFATLAIVSVGLVFQLPVFILALVRLGVTSSRKLRSNRQYGYAAMAALAVALPGVDPITTALEMVPLMVLFEGSIWLSVFFERRWNARSVSTMSPAAP